MSRATSDGCGCFPTGRHYAGIAHLLKVAVRGLASAFAADEPWRDIRIAMIDVETTGRDASVDRVVELGIVIGQAGRVVERHNWLIQPGILIPKEVQAVHGITDEDVKDSPRFEAIAKEILAALRDAVPAAYNAPFDRAFVHGELSRAKSAGAIGDDAPEVPAFGRDVEWIDPLVWARDLHRSEKSRALGDVAARLGIKLENAHRASDDAEAALAVLYALGADARVPQSYGAFVQEQRRLAQAQADQRRMWRT